MGVRRSRRVHLDTFCVFLFFLFIIKHVNAIRMVVFNTCAQQRLNDSPISTVFVHSELECARRCSEHSQCWSANYRSQPGEEKCELFAYKTIGKECESFTKDTENKILLPIKKCLNGGHVDASGMCNCMDGFSGAFCQDEESTSTAAEATTFPTTTVPTTTPTIDCSAMSDTSFTTDPETGVEYRFGTAVMDREPAIEECEVNTPGAHLLSSVNQTILNLLKGKIEACPTLSAASLFHIDGRAQSVRPFLDRHGQPVDYPSELWSGSPTNPDSEDNCICLTKDGQYLLAEEYCALDGYPICQLNGP